MPLLDFSRGQGNVLAITGPSGCGKSILSGWIVERLQRPLGRKTHHEMLSFSIDTELANECTLLAVSKNLALQLLNSSIVDVTLLKALGSIYSSSLGCTGAADLEKRLWNAIHIGLKNSNAKNLIIVADGLDD
jgi:ABC-type dipeptide/oligopeptide/nickel transport system ATPase component